MAIVKVWNDNVHKNAPSHFVQKFKGAEISIPAGGSIDMEYEEAVEFQGLYFPMDFDGSNIQKPSSYKMIRVDKPSTPVVPASQLELMNHMTGKPAQTKDELLQALKAFEDRRVTDPDAEAQAKASDHDLRLELSNMKTMVEQLMAQVAGANKKTPGKVKKEA